MKTFATLPDGTKRYFEDLMTHPSEIVKDSKRLEAFMSFFAVLEEYVSNLPPKTEVLDIFGRVVTNTFNIIVGRPSSLSVTSQLRPAELII